MTSKILRSFHVACNCCRSARASPDAGECSGRSFLPGSESTSDGRRLPATAEVRRGVFFLRFGELLCFAHRISEQAAPRSQAWSGVSGVFSHRLARSWRSFCSQPYGTETAFAALLANRGKPSPNQLTILARSAIGCYRPALTPFRSNSSRLAITILTDSKGLTTSHAISQSFGASWSEHLGRLFRLGSLGRPGRVERHVVRDDSRFQ